MKSKFLLLLLIFIYKSADSQNNLTPRQLKISSNGHYLVRDDGKPFFWLGDTGWELFHRLNLEEINLYLDNRQKKGFNVIQAVVLAEFDGLRKPNRYGEVPFKNLDPTQPNEKYFELIDATVKLALSKNMYMGLLPTWGDKITQAWGEGPVVFNVDNAYKYGLWIAKRYAKYSNIIWILGGDRPAVKDSLDYRPIWRAMAKGILEGTQQKVLITYHPSGGSYSTSQYIHTEPWLDINMVQSGHGGGHDSPVWNLIGRDRNLLPTKPVLDAEPNYEDHPVNPWPKWNPDNGYYRDYDVRKQTYRSVFSGACGVTYGHHAVWQFMSEREETINYPDRGWLNAIDRPGATQVGYLKQLIESRSQLDRVPDQKLILEGQGEKGEYICAIRDSAIRYIMVYLPVGKKITINTQVIKSKKIDVSWFNPKNAQAIALGLIDNTGKNEFTPPTVGLGNDWVLIINRQIGIID